MEACLSAKLNYLYEYSQGNLLREVFKLFANPQLPSGQLLPAKTREFCLNPGTSISLQITVKQFFKRLDPEQSWLQPFEVIKDKTDII
ncbi:MAG: hypothetical protein AB1390_04005 [Nitrospirota bacterium]